MLPRRLVPVAGGVRTVGEYKMEARFDGDHCVFQLLVSELIQRGVQLAASLCILQHSGDLHAQIAFKEGTKFWIDALFELSFELCRREILGFQISRNELRKHETAIKKTGEPPLRRRLKAWPRASICSRRPSCRDARCRRRSSPSPGSAPGHPR